MKNFLNYQCTGPQIRLVILNTDVYNFGNDDEFILFNNSPVFLLLVQKNKKIYTYINISSDISYEKKNIFIL